MTKIMLNEQIIREAAFYRWLARGAPNSLNPEIDWFGAKQDLEDKVKNGLKFLPIKSIFGLRRRMIDYQYNNEQINWIISNIRKYSIEDCISEYLVSDSVIEVVIDDSINNKNIIAKIIFAPISKRCSYLISNEWYELDLNTDSDWEKLFVVLK